MPVDRRQAMTAVFALVVGCVSAELVARIDDWVRFGTALWTNPSNGVDLRIADSSGVRGRPYGRYQQFVLNNHGFRSGRDHTLKPSPSCVRIMTLGASETFGLLEPPGEEYPAQLERQLNARGSCYEVLNAAVAGMSLPAIHYTWSRYWRNFEPDYVVVYPSPVFYLDERRPKPPAPEQLRRPQRPWPPVSWKPRLIHRLKEAVEFPALIQRRRVQRSIQESLGRIGVDSIWTAIPQDRLAQFSSDLSALVSAIDSADATAVVMTHAHRSEEPLGLDDVTLLQAWRSQFPRAEVPVLIAFDTAASRATRDVAVAMGARLVDLDHCLSGRRSLFGDQVHFTVEGSRRVAQLIAKVVLHDPVDSNVVLSEWCGDSATNVP